MLARLRDPGSTAARSPAGRPTGRSAGSRPHPTSPRRRPPPRRWRGSAGYAAPPATSRAGPGAKPAGRGRRPRRRYWRTKRAAPGAAGSAASRRWPPRSGRGTKRRRTRRRRPVSGNRRRSGLAGAITTLAVVQAALVRTIIASTVSTITFRSGGQSNTAKAPMLPAANATMPPAASSRRIPNAASRPSALVGLPSSTRRRAPRVPRLNAYSSRKPQAAKTDTNRAAQRKPLSCSSARTRDRTRATSSGRAAAALSNMAPPWRSSAHAKGQLVLQWRRTLRRSGF